MRAADPAGTLARLLAGMSGKQSGGINVGTICRVLAFDKDTCKATVQPLIRSGQDDPAPIQNVIALGQRLAVNGVEQSYKPVLYRDDVVFVVFADQEIKNGLTGRVSSPDSSRKHDKNDGVIIGIFPGSL
ncbi:Gp138 family membrane-puncturing spike protein [Paenibacillus spongiae]|uniref:Phage protein Gp138 N-terminal domain-containing protein n=1 Tax=Paenibacillus spongiae TaxID=2909671 RepID=A0ABY5S2Q5_9BACL|nr:Gp138 family membrane-puncturing spike protein [Paenibacillus spongiae]UVI28161.1 hypothetical protein L1F29_22245 [Paenibacillus spongiae]